MGQYTCRMKLGYVLMYVGDVEKAMDFYEHAFGLEKGFLHPTKQYGEMVTGDSKLGFAHHETASSHGFSYRPVQSDAEAPGIEIGLVAGNAKETQEAYDKAVAAGATPMSPPKIKPWGQVVSYVKDLNGFLVEICSKIGFKKDA